MDVAFVLLHFDGKGMARTLWTAGSIYHQSSAAPTLAHALTHALGRQNNPATTITLTLPELAGFKYFSPNYQFVKCCFCVSHLVKHLQLP